ncbi:hypothetical protein OS493_005725 [Desmophyllum pertusum]|uniref:Uncharacterized protein n=1 Tax=Desmophyllum pertusum TaxID=174260 RepID=A0A9W9YF88_9CNID|nr:hypothetical protein OS493_005725 [Desmophyllum pertusum]
MNYFKSKDVLYTTSVVLLVLFYFSDYAESKPTISSPNPSQFQPNGTKQGNDSDHATEDAASLMTRGPGYEVDDAAVQSVEENRVKREVTLSNHCVIGYNKIEIDKEKVFVAAICAVGCNEIKRVFFFDDREPLVIAVNCQKKK